MAEDTSPRDSSDQDEGEGKRSAVCFAATDHTSSLTSKSMAGSPSSTPPSADENTDDQVAIEISDPDNNDDYCENGNHERNHASSSSGRNDKRPGLARKNSSYTFSLRSVQLVELSLQRITYAPVTRSAGGGGGGGRRLNSASSALSGFDSSLQQKRKAILSDVTTTVAPHCLSAWMGPSGCGKTSLVSVAAGLIREPASDLAGHSRIRINGEEGKLPKRLVGVVWQDDLLLSNLTVEETVRFAARLTTPRDSTDEEVKTLVNDTINRLGLNDVRHSLVGVPGGSGSSRGISGGQRKRVAVAVELVARPSILLLDEPTSGLDSSTAYELMRTLKKLTKVGHSVAVVIHQPRTEIFNMFDNLLLLSQGRVVYEGEPSRTREFLESCPGAEKLPPETGKADWIMDVINNDEKREGGPLLPKLWQAASSKRQQQEPCRPKHQLTRRLSSIAELNLAEPKFQSSFWTQLRLLAIRASRQQRGERLTLVGLLLMFSWTAFTCLAWGRMPDTTTYVFSRASLLFFFIIAQSNSVVTSSLVIFAKDRALLSRERAKKLYGVLPYFIAMTISDMINSVALPTLYGIIVYWICGLRPTASAFFTFVLILYLTISAAQSTGLFLSVLIPNTAMALMLAPLLTICLMIIGGFYMPYDLISPALRWASWLSMARYGFSAFIVNEFGSRSVPCGDSPDGLEECPMPGSAVIASFGIKGVWTSIWMNVGMLAVIQIVLRFSTYIILRRSK